MGRLIQSEGTWKLRAFSPFIAHSYLFYLDLPAAAAKSLQSCPTLCDPIDSRDSPGKNTGVGCHFLLQCMKVKSESEVAQSCLTLRDPMDCSLPGSSVHGIFQARVLEWGAIAFSVLIYSLIMGPIDIYCVAAMCQRLGTESRHDLISEYFI